MTIIKEYSNCSFSGFCVLLRFSATLSSDSVCMTSFNVATLGGGVRNQIILPIRDPPHLYWTSPPTEYPMLTSHGYWPSSASCPFTILRWKKAFKYVNRIKIRFVLTLTNVLPHVSRLAIDWISWCSGFSFKYQSKEYKNEVKFSVDFLMFFYDCILE